MLDLASRGELLQSRRACWHRQEGRHPGSSCEPERRIAQRRLNRRRPLSDAEVVRARASCAASPARRTTATSHPTTCSSSASTRQVHTKIEDARRRQRAGSASPPSKSIERWRGAACSSIVGGVVAVRRRSRSCPAAGSSCSARVASPRGHRDPRSSPVRCRPERMAGAMIYAMLAAYRRTLQKTMEQARSMNQVVDEAKSTGSRRPTRPSSGAWRWVSRTTSSTSSSAAPRTPRAAGSRLHPVSAALVRHELVRLRRRRRSRRHGAGPVLGLGHPGLRRHVSAPRDRSATRRRLERRRRRGGFGGGGWAAAAAAPAAASS